LRLFVWILLSTVGVFSSPHISADNLNPGYTRMHWGKCTPEEIRQGYVTGMSWHNGVGGGDLFTACLKPKSSLSQTVESLEVFDVLFTNNGTTERVRCCGSHHLPRECPCPDQ
jgi:hypothetical protein